MSSHHRRCTAERPLFPLRRVAVGLMADEENGWRHGRDPVQRWLRVVTTVVVLGVFVYLALGENPTDRAIVIALALGAVLVLLGYEGIVRMPFIDRDKRDE